MGEAALPTETGVARSTLLPSTTYNICAEVLMAILTAERLVGWVTGGSNEKALLRELEDGVLHELIAMAPAARARRMGVLGICFMDTDGMSILHCSLFWQKSNI